MNYQQFFEEAIEIDDSDALNTRSLRNRNAINKDKVNESKISGNSLVEKRIRKLVAGSKFLSDFDPEKSTRERRKLTRKCYTQTPSARSLNVYDEKGRYRSNGGNICDCLDNHCTGCHFPCPNCKSPKCGTACRANRKWAYECIEHDGKDLVIKNKNLDFKPCN